jgi:hypothetical protein
MEEDAKNLSTKAQGIFSNIIFPVFSRYNLESVLVGSVFYDLMTWKDIDLYISLNSEEDFASFKKATSDFMNREGIWSVHFKNNLKVTGELIDPNIGYSRAYIGLRYCTSTDIKHDTWKIDCHLILSKDLFSREIEKAISFKNSLNKENRLVILEAKKALSNSNGDMPVGMSNKIYEMVVRNGVHDIESIVSALSK